MVHQQFSNVKIFVLFLLLHAFENVLAQNRFDQIAPEERREKQVHEMYNQFVAMSALLDASCNSLNALSSLVRKEAYRIKITSLNNPTSTELGFSLESEIQAALQPLLRKSKSVNATKFSSVVSSLIATPQKNGFNTSSIPSTILSLVGTLTLNDKRLTQHDLDSFIQHVSKYFLHYQRLDRTNEQFDLNINRLNSKLNELQFDLKEYMYDMILVLHPKLTRSHLKSLPIEDNLLKYLDPLVIQRIFQKDTFRTLYFPADGIKGAKEIAYSIQKLYNEYEKIYVDNYTEIRSILIQSKQITHSTNMSSIDRALKELEFLYNESKRADVFNIRMNTLFERLKVLVNSESGSKKA